MPHVQRHGCRRRGRLKADAGRRKNWLRAKRGLMKIGVKSEMTLQERRTRIWSSEQVRQIRPFEAAVEIRKSLLCRKHLAGILEGRLCRSDAAHGTVGYAELTPYGSQGKPLRPQTRDFSQPLAVDCCGSPKPLSSGPNAIQTRFGAF